MKQINAAGVTRVRGGIVMNKTIRTFPRAVKIALWVLLGIAAAFFAFVYIKVMPYINVAPVTAEQLDEIGLADCDSLMIVAHPDDEYIWGGAHLLEGRWFVVVLTNGNNKTRAPEFKKMTDALGNKGLILSYPDKIAGSRSDWAFWEDSITADLRTILTYKRWSRVVTHNAEGEYGHQHHIATHRLTVAAYDETGIDATLYFFGRYHKNGEIPADLPHIDDAALAKKLTFIDIYESQHNTIEKLRHMFPYENWETYRTAP